MPLDPLAAQRAGVDQRRERLDRAQVGVEAEALAKAEQALLGARRVGIGAVPLRAADGAEQDGVGAAAGVEDLVGERRAELVDGGAADRVLLVVEAPQASSTRCAAATISGPMPSPARTSDAAEVWGVGHAAGHRSGPAAGRQRPGLPGRRR